MRKLLDLCVMDSMWSWIGAAVALIGIAAYAFRRVVNRKVDRVLKERAPQTSSIGSSGPALTHRSPNPSKAMGSGSAQRGRSAECEALRQRLRLPLNYDEDKIDRLVAMERDRTPRASEEQLLSAAYERWVQDNR